MKLFSLSANTKLAESICEYFKTVLCKNVTLADSALTHFADGEVLFETKVPVRGEDVIILQSTCAPANDTLMELLICVDACKRASAKSITVMMPYYGYSRQDRKGNKRQSISAKLVADLLQTAGVNRLICVDLHATQIVGFFDIPVDNMSAVPLFYNKLKNDNLKNVVCVSPDHGGVVRTTALATKLNVPLAIIDKRRPEPNKCEILSIVGEVKGKRCIIVDDIVDTAGTLCNAADELKKLGAERVEAFITHGVLSLDAVDKIEKSGLDKLVITDSIALKKESNKIEVISLNELLAKIILALMENRPFGEVLDLY